MDDIFKKFPKICSCPYKKDIDKDLKKGKTPYYISKWLEGTECPISDATIRRYQKYLIEEGLIDLNEQVSPSDAEDELITLLQQKATEGIRTLKIDGLSDNVKVQLILGACKLIYGNKHQVDMAASVNQKANVTIDETVLKELTDVIKPRYNRTD